MTLVSPEQPPMASNKDDKCHVLTHAKIKTGNGEESRAARKAKRSLGSSTANGKLIVPLSLTFTWLKGELGLNDVWLV